jgi:hypothetical protein
MAGALHPRRKRRGTAPSETSHAGPVDEEHLPEFVEEVETTAHVVEPPSTLALSAPDVPAVVSKAHVLSRSRPKALPPPKKH